MTDALVLAAIALLLILLLPLYGLGVAGVVVWRGIGWMARAAHAAMDGGAA